MLRWWWWSEKNDDDDTIHFLDCSCHSFASSSWFSPLPWLFFALCNRCIEREKGSSKRVINLRSIIVIDFLDSLSATSLGVCDASASFFFVFWLSSFILVYHYCLLRCPHQVPRLLWSVILDSISFSLFRVYILLRLLNLSVEHWDTERQTTEVNRQEENEQISHSLLR